MEKGICNLKENYSIDNIITILGIQMKLGLDLKVKNMERYEIKDKYNIYERDFLEIECKINNRYYDNILKYYKMKKPYKEKEKQIIRLINDIEGVNRHFFKNVETISEGKINIPNKVKKELKYLESYSKDKLKKVKKQREYRKVKKQKGRKNGK